MTEYDLEATPGLPGQLPPGERIVWQGKPDARVLARAAFHVRLVAGYFTLLAAVALASALANGVAGPADLIGVAGTLAAGALGVALLRLLAWASARSTIYTLTDRRLVLRIGIAVPKCINLPLGAIEAVDLAVRGDGSGDLPLRLNGTPKLGYLTLWPHARAWAVVAPQPMLRAVPQAASVAALIARTCLAANPNGRIATVEDDAPAVAAHFTQALAA
ncbi:photosynthetic complex putative assembly protein PuhB [Sphingomonas sp.]|uniref:photosynthetic complex putative assembly protein PuhB n=1 Tax=Sphingomonas sp. TaxID=28214 RepID=UPI0035BC75E1